MNDMRFILSLIKKCHSKCYGWDKFERLLIFISFEEKPGVGSVGQLECLRKSVVSLYSAEDHANLGNNLMLIQAHHISPVSDEIGDLAQPVENNQESNMDIMMTPGRKVRRHTKNAKKKCGFLVHLTFQIKWFSNLKSDKMISFCSFTLQNM